MASLYPHKRFGWQVLFRIYFTDGTHKDKTRYAKIKSKAILIHQDAERLETLSLHQRLTSAEILYFLHQKLLTPDEAPKITREEIPLVAPEAITWDALADVWYKHINTVGSRQTRGSYHPKVKPILEYFRIKGIAPAKVTEEAIKGYVSHRRATTSQRTGEPIAKATINKEITILRVMLDDLVQRKILKENPARVVKRFDDPPARPPRALYPEELKTILAAVDAYTGPAALGYFPEIVMAYLWTGMRRYELLELERANVRLKEGVIRLRGKGDKTREIEIHRDLLPHLKRVVEKNGEKKGRYFFGGGDQPLMDPNSMYRAFKKFALRQGLPDSVTLHTLRHTWTSYLLDSGVPAREVQDQAGHEDLKTTMRYAHRVPRKDKHIHKLDYQSYLDEVSE